MIKVIEDFLPNPEGELEQAARAEYKDLTFDGIIYPKIAISERNDLVFLYKMEKLLGKKLTYSLPPFYRKYLPTDPQPTFIHSDVNEGDYTVIVFLNKINQNNGIAFWTYPTGATMANKLNVGMYTKEGQDETKWQEPLIIQADFNTAVVFDAARFHSRWPKNNWQIGDDKARLVKVMFLKEIRNDDSN